MKWFSLKFKRALRALQQNINPKRELSDLINDANPKSSLAEQVKWLESLVEWIRSASLTTHDFEKNQSKLQWVRLKFLFQFLDRLPEKKTAVSQVLQNMIAQTSGVDLFSRTELTQGSLWLEFVDRLMRKMLPSPPRERYLDDLFLRIFKTEEDALWIEQLPPDIFEGIRKLIQGDTYRDVFANSRKDLLDALLILGETIAAKGLSYEFRKRLHSTSVEHSVFLTLRKAIETTTETQHRQTTNKHYDCRPEIEKCREAIGQIIHNLDESGVSVELVYHLEWQKAALRRVEMILSLLTPKKSELWPSLVSRFIAELIRENLHEYQLGLLLKNNFRLLSQKIVERAGASGEHYLTRTPEEYREMFSAGLGGGFLTVITTLLKLSIQKLKLALFFEGLFASLNYGISFSIISLCHFTLATKQPAMTGPALAGKLRALRGPRDIKAFVDEVTNLTRSQFAAAFGNVGAAFPAAILMDLIWWKLTDQHILSDTKAIYEIQKLNPLTSGTLFFATWTGVTLWSSGIAAGWIENWIVYHRLPEAIGCHPFLVAILGKSRAGRVGNAVLRNSGSLFSSFFLGALLGFTPIFGAFFGIPLDVRHVTLSSASLGLAIATQLGPLFDYTAFVWAVVGIICILILNLSVSLSLAFFVACRAREVRTRSILILIRATLSQLRKKPLSFFFYPRSLRH